MPRPRLLASLPALLAILALSACGSSGSKSDGTALVKQTFGNASKVRSGNLSVLLNVQTHGIASLAGPIQLRFSGPFEKPTAKQTPRFAFTFAGSLAGHSFDAGATSTGKSGYLTLGQESYPLPAAQFAIFQKSFSSVQGIAQPKTSASGKISWLSDPTNDGSADVSGQKTTKVSATVDVAKLVATLDDRRPAASRLSPKQRQGIADAVKDPRFVFYTGASDHILRRVTITFKVIVPASAQQQLGGLKDADVTVDYAIAGLNQPQTIRPPANLRPASELAPRLRDLAQKLQAVGSLLNGAAGSTGSSSGSGTTGGAAQIQRYQACLTNAAGNAAAVKKCLAILQAQPTK